MLKVLFVCLGNICRSPAAHGIFLELIEREGLSDHFKVDSAGTSGYHAGSRADARMRDHSSKRGFELNSLSRQFIPQDFEKFDYILTMDKSNFSDVIVQTKDENERSKVRAFTDFCFNFDIEEVPDPYYDGERGFEHVLDIVEDGCRGFMKEVAAKEIR